ncbi:MAG: outer membrane beta-barrel protein [bacterium]|nr:outer membrane beta-barrel protein [Candidatus Kapabacteria bacterium]
MRILLPVLLILTVVMPMRGDPPEEDILRPRIPTHGSFFVGLDVGLNTSWFDGNPIYRAFFPSEEESRMFRSAFGFEPFGSVYVGMRITPNLKVRVRGDYDVRVARRSGTTIDTCPIFDVTTSQVVARVPTEVQKDFELEISYLTFSVLGEYAMGQMFVFVGPSWSMPIKRSFSEVDQIVDPNSVGMFFSNTPDSTRQIRAERLGTDNVASVVSIKLGVGYIVPMSDNLSLVPQIGFDFPFGSALEDDEDFEFRKDPGPTSAGIVTRLNRHMYYRALQASIGLRLSF